MDFLDSFKNDFVRNFITDNRWKWLIDGLKNTMIITFFSLLLGLAIGILIAIIRSTFDKNDAPKHVFVTYGTQVSRVMEAVDILAKENIRAGILLLEELKPYSDIASIVEKYTDGAEKILFVEEGIKNGGAGMLLAEALYKLGVTLENRYDIAAIDDNFASPSTPCDLYEYLGLGPVSLAERMAGK